MDTDTPTQKLLELFLSTRTEESFRLLCDALSPRLLRYFRARACDAATAEELAQDVLFTLFRRAYTIKDPRLLRAWLYRVAQNALLQRLRSARRRIRTVSEEEAGAGGWERAAAEDSFTELDAALGALAAEEREILLLRYHEGLDYREISAALRIPAGTAKWRVFNSKLKLASELRKGGRK